MVCQWVDCNEEATHVVAVVVEWHKDHNVRRDVPYCTHHAELWAKDHRYRPEHIRPLTGSEA